MGVSDGSLEKSRQIKHLKVHTYVGGLKPPIEKSIRRFLGACSEVTLIVQILCLSAGFLSGPLLVSFFSIILERSLWRRKPMTTPAIRNVQESTTAATLFVAFELSEK